MVADRERLVEQLFETGLVNGGCITLISGVPPEAITRAFGVLGASFDDPIADVEPTIRVYSLPSGALCVVEEFGADLAFRPPVLMAAALRGRGGAFHWTVDF